MDKDIFKKIVTQNKKLCEIGGCVGTKKHVTLEVVSKPHNDQGSRLLTVYVVASEDVCLPVLLSGRLSCCSMVRSNEETQGHYKPGHILKSNLLQLL